MFALGLTACLLSQANLASLTTPEGKVVKVPIQRNEYDCGLFMLHNAERFAVEHIPLPLPADVLADWYPAELVETKERGEIQGILMTMHKDDTTGTVVRKEC